MKKAYRGKSLRIAYGITMLVLLLMGSASALYDTEAHSFLGLINNYRAQNNLGKLIVDAKLQESANSMSNDMLLNCVTGKYTCSHTDSTGRTFVQRLLDFGYPAGVSASAAENIAWGYGGGASSAQQAFDLWKNSPGHRTNMLGSSFVAISISRSCNAGDCAWVTDFGSMILKSLNNDPIPIIVDIRDNFFSNSTITIPVNTQVTWINSGSATHTVTADDGSFNSGNLVTNQSFNHNFTKAGNFTYHCNIHPVMTGIVIVTSSLPKTGDINGDGKLTLVDAIYLAKHVGGFSGYETIYAGGDINANGIVTLVDAIYLAKHVGGFIGYEKIY